MSDKSSPETSSVNATASTPEGFRFVDNYGLLLCLGEGGMGEVWAARDATSTKNRIIALKMTKQQGVEAAKILYDEARIASMIDHPNVCRVHHLGRAGDVQYLVMDYCDGASLHDLLQALPNRKMPIPLACRVLAHASAGLHAAHTLTDDEGTKLGVVHRDVSPQNLLISTQGIVTVTDFGVAKALGQAHKATETGEMKGKLSYMAPEQVTSKDIDARADVFALGCVLYQLTLGQRPFHGDDALSTLYQLLEEELTLPTQVDPDFPPELEKVIEKALAKERDQRFQTAAEFRRALEEVLLHLDVRSTHADVAALMEEHLGDTLNKRKQLLTERNEALSHFDRSQASASDIAATAEQSSSQPGRPGEKTITATEQSARPPSKKSTNLTAFLVFALVAVGGILILTSKTDNKPAQAPQAQAAPPPAPSEPTTSPPSTNEAEPVTLEVAATPSEADILLDGERVGKGKFKDEFEPSTDGHILKIEAEGYESVTRAIVFDKSQSVTIALPAKKQVVAPAPRPKGFPKPAPPPASSKKPATKTPRKLDSNNPFATP